MSWQEERLRHIEELNKSASVWQGWVSYSVVGKYTQTRQRQLRGKTVKHQPRQALYRGPCRALQRGSKKRSIFYELKRKNRARRKEKKIRKKTEKKRKETKKKEGVSSMGMHQQIGFPLSPFKSYLFPKRKQGLFLWGNNHSGPTPSKPLIPMAGSFSWGIICIEKRRSPLFGFAAAD